MFTTLKRFEEIIVARLDITVGGELSRYTFTHFKATKNCMDREKAKKNSVLTCAMGMNFGLARAQYERQWFWGQVGFYSGVAGTDKCISQKGIDIIIITGEKRVWIERIFRQVKKFAHRFLQCKQPRVCVCFFLCPMRN